MTASAATATAAFKWSCDDDYNSYTLSALVLLLHTTTTTTTHAACCCCCCCCYYSYYSYFYFSSCCCSQSHLTATITTMTTRTTRNLGLRLRLRRQLHSAAGKTKEVYELWRRFTVDFGGADCLSTSFEALVQASAPALKMARS